MGFMVARERDNGVELSSDADGANTLNPSHELALGSHAHVGRHEFGGHLEVIALLWWSSSFHP